MEDKKTKKSGGVPETGHIEGQDHAEVQGQGPVTQGSTKAQDRAKVQGPVTQEPTKAQSPAKAQSSTKAHDPVTQGSTKVQDLIVLAPPPPYTPPPVYITELAVLGMYDETMKHPNIETGWGMYGLEFPNGTILVYNILPMFDDDIVRRVSTTEVGGSNMVDSLNWLKSNHELMLKQSKNEKRTQSPQLTYLWKGHSHHKLGLKRYSHTDTTSIVEAVEKDGMKVAIGPLVNIIGHGIKIEYDRSLLNLLPISTENVLKVRDLGSIEIRFYYFDRTMLELGYKSPILITPTVVNQKVAEMPPLGWKFTNNAEYSEQLRHLKNYGCNVQVIHQDTDGKPPYEIKFVITHPEWVPGQILIIETSWNFPEVPPRWFILPKPEGEEKPEVKKPPLKRPKWLTPTIKTTPPADDPLWKKGDDFIDLIFKLEDKGLLKKKE